MQIQRKLSTQEIMPVELTSNTTEKRVIDIIKKNNIDLVLNVPCGMMKSLISLVPEEIMLPISRESVGIGIATGAYLAGAKPLLLIQNTGIGNSIINIASLHENYEIPLPILFSWRGKENENIDAQKKFGESMETLLEALNIPYWIAKNKEDAQNIDFTIQTAYEHNKITGCLISPIFWDNKEKTLVNYTNRYINNNSIEQEELNGDEITLSRYSAIETIVDVLDESDPESVLVCNLGIPSMELYNIIQKKNSKLRVFYMLAGFGEVSSIGLGLSMFSSRNIYVIDGDGSLFHNPNVFDSIHSVSPKNLKILAIDNGVHSSTGNQMTASYLGIDLQTLAKAYGLKNTSRILDETSLNHCIKENLKTSFFAHVIVQKGSAPVSEIPLSCVDIKESLMNRL